MTVKKAEQNTKQSSLLVQVSTDLTVQLIPNQTHEFLMTTHEVAVGYGVTDYAIRKNKMSLGDELQNGKHYFIAVTIGNGSTAPNAILWTKRGIIRLGFAMRSVRAKLFRDWAEDFIINQNKNLLGETIAPQLPAKRKHNRLTQERVIDILHDVCKIEDSELRNRISNKLKGGYHA